MANIAKIELGDTTYDIKDAIVRPKIDAITAEDTDGNTYVQTSKLTVNGDSNLNGTVTANAIVVEGPRDSNTSAFTIKSENIDRDTTETITETKWGSKFRFLDNNDENIGYIEPFQRPSGTTGLRIISWNEKSDESAAYNSLTLEVAKDGTASYSVSNPANFCSAIGAVSKAGDTITGTVKFVHNNLTRSTTVSSATDGTAKLEFYDKSNNLMNFITSHKNPDGTNYTRLTTYSPNGQQTANLYLGHDNTNKRIGVDAQWTTSLYMSGASRGYYLKDQTGATYPGIFQNGTNLWLGAESSTSYSHRGQTFISAGYDGSDGNETIFVFVPNSTNTAGQSYGVYHTGWKPTYSDVGAAAASHNHSAANITSGTLETARGGLGSTTYSKSTLTNIGTLERYGHLRILRVMTTNTVNLSDSWTELQVGSVLAASDRPTVNIYSTGIADDTGGVGVGLLVQTDGKFIVRGRGGTPVGNHKVSGELCWIII